MPISDAAAGAVLPPRGFVRDFVQYAYLSTDAPLIYSYNTALAVLAAIAPDMAVPMYGSHVYSTWYGLTVAPSGARKTHAIGLGTKVLREVAERKIGEQPSTPEGLMRTLGQRPEQLIVWGEFGAFLAHTGAARTYAAPLRELVVSAWDCEPMEYAKAKATMRVPRPRLSILGGCTPSLLSAHTTVTDWTGGFMSRFATFYARRERLQSRSQPTGDRFVKLVESLQLRHEAVENGSVARCMGFDFEAVKRWDAWVADIDTRFAEDPREYAEGAAVRTPTIALKVALLYSLDFGQAAELGEEAEYYISDRVLERAIALAELHQQSVIELCDTLVPTLYSQQRQGVLSVLRQLPNGDWPVMQRGDIMAMMVPRVSRRTMNEILDSLVDEGAIYRMSTSGGATWFSRAKLVSDLGTTENVLDISAALDDVGEL